MSTVPTSASRSNRTILIVKSTDEGMGNTERFLHLRGWDVKVVTGSLSRGVQAAAIFDPLYIFLSTNMIPPDYTPLYGALRKSFHVILFAEQHDARSLRLIRELGTSDVIRAPLTGPMIERAIFKLSAEPPPSLVPFEMVQIEIHRMSVATDRALTQLCRPPTGAVKERLGHCRKVYCFTVQTPRMCGYLVVAATKDVDGDMTARLRDSICQTMREAGDVFKGGEIHELDLHEVQFESLALSASEFFKKSEHLNSEMAIAFFRLNETEVPVQPSIRAGWVRTDLRYIAPESKLDFDLYIYLPANKKFILYKRSGDQMTEAQHNNLATCGLNEVHLKESSVPHLQKYRAKSYLNSLVDEFRRDNTEVTAV